MQELEEGLLILVSKHLELLSKEYNNPIEDDTNIKRIRFHQEFEKQSDIIYDRILEKISPNEALQKEFLRCASPIYYKCMHQYYDAWEQFFGLDSKKIVSI